MPSIYLSPQGYSFPTCIADISTFTQPPRSLYWPWFFLYFFLVTANHTLVYFCALMIRSLKKNSSFSRPSAHHFRRAYQEKIYSNFIEFNVFGTTINCFLVKAESFVHYFNKSTFLSNFTIYFYDRNTFLMICGKCKKFSVSRI